MDFEEFKEKLISELGERGLEVTTGPSLMVNEELTSIMLKEPESDLVPTLYVERIYEDYRSGVSMDFIADSVASALTYVPKDIDEVQEMLKKPDEKKLYCQLINTEKNKELLKDVPHINVLDMSLIARYMITEHLHFTINNRTCSEMKLTSDELMRTARSNTYENYSFLRVGDFINELGDQLGMPVNDDLESEKIPMHVLINEKYGYGAALITSKDVMDDIYGKLGNENFYVIPSSVMEIIIIPESFAKGHEETIKELISDINRMCLSENKRLSDNLYHYDGKLHVLDFAEARNKEAAAVKEMKEARAR